MPDVYLLTGGAGSIGANIVRQLLKQKCQIVVLDNFSAYAERYYRSWLPVADNVEIVRGDIRDRALVTKLVARADYVLHLAALADVGECTRNPRLEFEINVTGTQNVLDAVRGSAVRKLVFISSASVYGSPPGSIQDRQCRESNSCLPISNYGASKLWGEQRCMLYHRFYGVPVAALRLFSIYGSPQVPKQGSHSWCVAIFSMQLKLGLPITIIGDGEQIRDFVHVADVARAIILSAVNTEATGKVLNIGTGVPTTIRAMVSLLASNAGVTPSIQYLPLRPDDPSGCYADPASAARLIGWKSETALDDGVREYTQWLTEHLELIPEFIGRAGTA